MGLGPAAVVRLESALAHELLRQLVGPGGSGESVWKPEGADDWNIEVKRFLDNLAALDRAVADGAIAESFKTLIQAPLADALTHVGQLAMLRGMAGAPVRPESYARAEILAGRVGLEQAPPGREFNGDASARRQQAQK